MEASLAEDKQRSARYSHAASLLEAGIQIRRTGKLGAAVALLTDAEKRFASLNCHDDAELARAWAEGVQKSMKHGQRRVASLTP